jgi:hypothetical protein
MTTSTVSYLDVLALARQLDPAQQLRLLEALAGSVRKQVANQPRRRMAELRGLGKDIWKGIDAQKYVRQERAAWNG